MREYLLSCVLLGLVAGCARAPELPVARAGRASLARVLVESGEVSAVRSQTVRAPMEWSGDLQVTAMVPEGTLVAAGDTLVQLDPSALDREAETIAGKLADLAAQRRGVLASQESQRLRLRNAVATAELSREQATLQLEKLKFEAQTRREEARLSLSNAGVALEEARAKLQAQAVLDSLALAKTDLALASAQASQDGLRQRRAAMIVRAPSPGLVVYVESRDRQGNRFKPRVGDTVDPWRPLAEIPDLTQMQVEFPVHEVDRHRVDVGLSVRVRLEADPDTVFTGQIETIARLATEVADDSSVRAFAVRALLDGHDPRLRPGMTAVVEVALGASDTLVTMPRTGVFEQDGEPVVFPRATWPQPRPVRLAVLTPLVAGIAEGLAAGEAVVLQKPAAVTDLQPLGAAAHAKDILP